VKISSRHQSLGHDAIRNDRMKMSDHRPDKKRKKEKRGRE
jgi:hypothetical protein